MLLAIEVAHANTVNQALGGMQITRSDSECKTIQKGSKPAPDFENVAFHCVAHCSIMEPRLRWMVSLLARNPLTQQESDFCESAKSH